MPGNALEMRKVETGHLNESAAPVASAVAKRWRRAAGRALDLVFPPQCLVCTDLIEPGGALCPTCWNKMNFLAPPQCDACGVPFDFDLGGAALCGACAREHPPFRRARAVAVYGDTSRKLVLGFKHGDRTERAPHFGRWLARAGADLLAESDVIVPVPLHWTRLFTRRYNQAALLAHALSRETALPVATGVLTRRRRTPSLGRMSPSQRKRNLAGAFAVTDAARDALAGQNVLLIDDVMTTGATASACTRALKRAGAAAVDVLTLARAVREQG